MNPEKRGSKYKGVPYQAGHNHARKRSWVLSYEVHFSRNCMETLHLKRTDEREERKNIWSPASSHLLIPVGQSSLQGELTPPYLLVVTWPFEKLLDTPKLVLAKRLFSERAMDQERASRNQDTNQKHSCLPMCSLMSYGVKPVPVVGAKKFLQCCASVVTIWL